jgi:hypothetical protein
MDRETADRVAREAFADEGARAIAWDFAKELGRNYDAAAKSLQRATLTVVALISFFELLQLGVVADTAKLGPFEIDQTSDVQVVLPVLVSYFTFIAMGHRIFMMTARTAFELVMRTNFPSITASNLEQVMLAPSVLPEGIPNVHAEGSRYGEWDRSLGIFVFLLLSVGAYVFVAVALAQGVAAGARWWSIVPASLVSTFFAVRFSLVLLDHLPDYAFLRDPKRS